MASFLQWLKFFVEIVRPTADHKVLLLLDNHESHCSLNVAEYTCEHHVEILSFPPHTSHKLQPLDVAVYGPLDTFFEAEIKKWQRSHPACIISLYDLGGIFKCVSQMCKI